MAQSVKSAPPGRPAPLWIAIALAVVTLAVYYPVTGFQFINFDDPDFITANPRVQAGLTSEGFKWAWSSIVALNWHPITMLTFMLDCQLFGVKPWWPHLVNMVLHAANTALLFSVFKRMSGAVWRSAIVAAFFALHPLHVESVAWVSERKDVLSTLFWFLTIWAYVRYSQNSHSRWFYGLSLLFFALGLMSKPMLVTVPCTLLLLDFWPLGRMKAGAGAWRLAAEKIPFFALSAVLCVVTIRTQRLSGAMAPLQNFPLGERLGNALVSYVRYIEMMFWPRHLAGFYPMRLGPWPWWVAAPAGLSLLTVSVLVLRPRRRRPYLAVGWFWYLGTLVPASGVMQAGQQAMADRYTYIPLIGLFVMAAWGGWELAGAWKLGRFTPVATAGALAACAALTVHQEYYWKDAETYNQRIINVTSNNYIAHYNLGLALAGKEQFDEAIGQFQETIRLNPGFAEARNNLGAALDRKGRTDEAMGQFQEAVRLQRDNAQAHNNLGGDLALKGQIDEAIGQFREAIRLKPDFAQAHNNLGSALLRQKRYDEALEQFRTTVRLHPDYLYCFDLAAALTEAASVHHDTGESAEAARAFQQALELNPESSDARHNPGVAWQALGLLCASQNKMPEAEKAFRELTRLQPENADAWRWLGNALGAQSKLPDAISAFLAALRFNPSDWGTECNLAQALSLQGKRDEAAEHYRQALRINPNCAEAQTALKALENATNAPQGGK